MRVEHIPLSKLNSSSLQLNSSAPPAELAELYLSSLWFGRSPTPSICPHRSNRDLVARTQRREGTRVKRLELDRTGAERRGAAGRRSRTRANQ